MAAKVGLLAEDQDNSAIPAERVKRNVAEYLVRKLLAVQVSKYLFKRLKVNSARLQAIPEQLPKKPYIPHEYQHHIEPKIHRVDRRQMEELERWYAACCL